MSHPTSLIPALLTLATAQTTTLSIPPVDKQTTAITDRISNPLYRVEEHTLVLRDNARDKDLHIRIVYPDDPALKTALPTIIFSHGAGGSGLNYDPLAQLWATQGYIVILPTHSDAIINPIESNNTNPREKLTAIRDRLRDRRVNGRTKPIADFDFSDWPNRPKDISFIIDSLDTIEEQSPLSPNTIDRNRLGVGGHSYGAFTSQLIAGTDPIGPGSFNDPRATCALLISPQGTGGLLSSNSWDTFQGPALTITGDNDEGGGGQPAAWRREPYDLSPPNSHTLLWINNAYHNFGGISGTVLPLPDQGPENHTHVQLVQNATLVFWNHHLKDQSTNITQFAATLQQRLDTAEVTIEHN